MVPAPATGRHRPGQDAHLGSSPARSRAAPAWRRSVRPPRQRRRPVPGGELADWHRARHCFSSRGRHQLADARGHRVAAHRSRRRQRHPDKGRLSRRRLDRVAPTPASSTDSFSPPCAESSAAPAFVPSGRGRARRSASSTTCPRARVRPRGPPARSMTSPSPRAEAARRTRQCPPRVPRAGTVVISCLHPKKAGESPGP